MLTTHLLQVAQDILAAAPPTPPGPSGTPTPPPGPGGGIDTSGIVGFFGTQVAPILLAVLGVIFLGRANRGQVSRVMTSSAIALVGLAFIAGSATLFFAGDYFIDLIFQD